MEKCNFCSKEIDTVISGIHVDTFGPYNNFIFCSWFCALRKLRTLKYFITTQYDHNGDPIDLGGEFWLAMDTIQKEENL